MSFASTSSTSVLTIAAIEAPSTVDLALGKPFGRIIVQDASSRAIEIGNLLLYHYQTEP
jgi:hypothetical protein